MKNYLLLLALVLVPVFCFSQLTASVDKFDGTKMLKTNWVKLNDTKASNLLFVRFSKVDTFLFLECKLSTNGNILHFAENADCFFKLSGGEMLRVNNAKSTIVSKGGGAVENLGKNELGVHLAFLITRQDLEKLSTLEIEGARITATTEQIDIFPDKADLRENAKAAAASLLQAVNP